MFASRKWTRIALALNVAGGLLLFYSFQATSSSFRLVRRPISAAGVLRGSYEYDICVENYTFLATEPEAGAVELGHAGCPTPEDDRPAAVVNTEHPNFITIGFLTILLGFII